MSKLPFGFEAAEDSPGFLLWQTTMTWQRLIRQALEPFDVSHPQFVLMATLLWCKKQHLATPQKFLIEWTKLDKMTVSQSLKKLAKHGLVHRAEDQTDTRAKNVTLTTRGEELTCILVPVVEKIDDDFFGKAPGKEAELIKILRKLTAHSNEE